MFEDVSPSFVNRSKATSTRLQPNGIYVAIVTRVTESERIYVKVPKFGGINEYGPCVVAGVIPSVDDFVLVGFLDNKMSEIICFGTFSQHPPSYELFSSVTSTLAPKENPTFTGTVVLPTATTIGNVSSAEIGYVDGVTSSIQTQLNTKAPLASPTFTGTVVLPSDTSIGTVSATEIGYVDGVTSAIQTQINAKAPLSGPTFTGTVVLPSTTSIGTVSSTEIGYVDGVTSAIQTQLDSKAAIAGPTFTGTVTGTFSNRYSIGTASQTNFALANGDIGKLIECTLSGMNIWIYQDALTNLPVGCEYHFVRRTSGTVSIVPLNGVLLNGTTATRTIRAQYSMITLIKRSTDEWYLLGDYA